MNKSIPLNVLKLLVGFPCEFTHSTHQHDIAETETGFLESVTVIGKHSSARVGPWNVKPEKVVPVLKDMSHLTPDQLDAFFKVWFETKIGIEDMADGTTVDCRVLEVERTGPYKFRVVTENTWNGVEDVSTDKQGPVKTTDEETWDFLPGSMEYLPVPAFFYLVSQGVDVWGLVPEGLAKRYTEEPAKQ